jgi:aspartate kinase
LFEDDILFSAVKAQFSDLEYFLAHNKSPNYNFVYDQVVSYGVDLDHYSCSFHEPYGYKTEWIDVRNFIKTDANYRDATVGSCKIFEKM